MHTTVGGIIYVTVSVSHCSILFMTKQLTGIHGPATQAGDELDVKVCNAVVSISLPQAPHK